LHEDTLSVPFSSTFTFAEGWQEHHVSIVYYDRPIIYNMHLFSTSKDLNQPASDTYAQADCSPQWVGWSAWWALWAGFSTSVLQAMADGDQSTVAVITDQTMTEADGDAEAVKTGGNTAMETDGQGAAS